MTLSALISGAALAGMMFAMPAQALIGGGLIGEALIAPGSGYVAMGSSYAAGPGITTPADHPPSRCARSQDNYAHQVARRLKLALTDVSCSGATTADLLGAWRELPAQVDAVTAQTQLVTVTIGGNDLNFVGNLNAASCRAAGGAACGTVKAPVEADYAALKASLNALVVAIRRRAPQARIVFVEYPVVLPPAGVCAATPMTADEADMLRATAARQAAITDAVAEADNTDVVRFAAHSSGHDACAADPWMAGFVDAAGQRTRVPYHPNLESMMAQADDIVALLGR